VRVTSSSGVDQIADAFARTGKRAALMPYLMAGYPTLAESVRIGEACVHAGADLLELGVPYSDPLADGPVIHAAGTHALEAGANMAWVLEVARALAPSVPVVLMCYANMVFAPGVDNFVERLSRTGACGLIVPDLPLEEATEVRDACDRRGLALVPLVAPTTPPERLAAIGSSARGFLYTVSVVGTTGERASMQASFGEVVAQAKASTHVPVALGFGIATAEHARQAADAGADGVIVGTRLVRAAGEGNAAPPPDAPGAGTAAVVPLTAAWAGGPDPAHAVGAVVGEIAAGLRFGR
jgi:tryptophan synthase alpha chain